MRPGASYFLNDPEEFARERLLQTWLFLHKRMRKKDEGSVWVLGAVCVYGEKTLEIFENIFAFRR